MTLDVLGVGFHGLTGSFLTELLRLNPDIRLTAPLRTSPSTAIPKESRNIDASSSESWVKYLESHQPEVIVLLSNIRHYIPLAIALDYLDFYPRIILVGTTGVYSRYKAYSNIYRDIEFLASDYRSALTIIRPSMIFGNSRDKNLHKVFLFISRYGFVPIIGNGSNLVHPVYYKDLASSIYNALIFSPALRAFDIAGPSSLTLFELFSEIFLVLGKQPRFLRFNKDISRASCSLISSLLGSRFAPVSVEQIDRLSEDKSFDISLAQMHLSYLPTSLRQSLLYEAVDLGLV